MSDLRKKMLNVVARQDQDMAQAVEWFKEQSNEDLAELWGMIQQNYENPMLEAMSRMAQIGFSAVALEAFRD
jgi:hypothetical protein